MTNNERVNVVLAVQVSGGTVIWIEPVEMIERVMQVVQYSMNKNLTH